jgi:nitrite reductase/ring-hydroxylating ferredoxin subunit
VLLVGGEDHKVGQEHDAAERYERLEAWARERFPHVSDVVHRWSGQVMETIDGLALIGRSSGEENVYVATGDCGMGLTHGTIAGLLLTDLIVGRENRWASAFDPGRIAPAAAMNFLRENLNVARQYANWLSPGDVASTDSVARGCGAVMWRGLKKIAVYRDDTGTLLEFSASCPHAGCIVTWNAAERTWDCPCHGSRFDCEGRVVQGPANDELTRVDE